MPSVSNLAVGAAMAGAAASKARHQMNESIARLSTGIRSMYGGDAAGQSVANSLGARGASFAVAARNAEDGIRDSSPSRGLGDVYKRQIVVLFYSTKVLNSSSNTKQIFVLSFVYV